MPPRSAWDWMSRPRRQHDCRYRRGTTEIAVIALSGIVNEESVRIRDEMNNAIIQFFKKNHNILIGERTAEAIKCEVGSAMP